MIRTLKQLPKLPLVSGNVGGTGKDNLPDLNDKDPVHNAACGIDILLHHHYARL